MKSQEHGEDKLNFAYLVVNVILVFPSGDSALNWIICPEERGKEGLNVGGLEVSYPIVRSCTLLMVSPASVGG